MNNSNKNMLNDSSFLHSCKKNSLIEVDQDLLNIYSSVYEKYLLLGNSNETQLFLESSILEYNKRKILESKDILIGNKIWSFKIKKSCEGMMLSILKSKHRSLHKKHPVIKLISLIKELYVSNDDFRDICIKILMSAYFGVVNKYKKVDNDNISDVLKNKDYYVGTTNGFVNISYYVIKGLMSQKEIKDRFREIHVLEEFLEIYSLSHRIELGNWVFNFMSLNPFKLFDVKYAGGNTSYIIFHEPEISKFKDQALPNYGIPMLSKPELWVDSDQSVYGGMISNSDRKQDIIPTLKGNKHKMENRERLYNAINFMNGNRFSINKDVLNFILKDESFFHLLYNNSEKDIKVKSKLTSPKSQDIITLKSAYLFRNMGFYIPLQSDWRGRIYSTSFYLNYQGSDLNRSLIQFYDGEVLSEKGLEYLFIYTANNHNENNISKKSNSSRIKWVHENLDKIVSLDKKFIERAENPFVFISCCFAIKQWKEDKFSIIHIPVLLDATCSGVQHFAGLLLDMDLAAATNVSLLDKDNDLGPEDYYSKLLEPINSAINKHGLNEDNNMANLIHVELTRNMIKPSVMTKNYNAKAITMGKQLRSKLEYIDIEEVKSSVPLKKRYWKVPDRHGNEVLLNFKEITTIGTIIHSQIFINYPNLKVLYDYLLSIVKLFNKLNIPLTWTTPTNIKLTQYYSIFSRYAIKLPYFTKQRELIYLEADFQKGFNKLKARDAFIPNFIHSLDASHLINIVNTFSLFKEASRNNIITIHDCFGTHPNKMNLLCDTVIKEFIKIYADHEYLLAFHKEIRNNIIKFNYEITLNSSNEEIVKYDNRKRDKVELLKIPSLPKKGILSKDNILRSKYMIT